MRRKKSTSLEPREASPKSLFEEFDRVFDEFRNGLEDVFSTPMLAPAGAWNVGVRQALVDVKDAGKEVVVTAELPGVSKDGLDIDATENGVEIRARAEKDDEREDEGHYHRERSYSQWYRRFPFPAEVFPDQAQAELKDGILTLRVPKKVPAQDEKPRKVPVR